MHVLHGYLGTHQTANAVKTLYTSIQANNNNSTNHQVEIELLGITNISEVSKNDKYTIECRDYSDDGYMNKIYVTKEIEE